jgi:phosphate transport system substrate-binding protein
MKKPLLLAVLFSGFLSASLLAQEPLRVHGANALWAPLSKDQAALEAAIGGKVSFVPNTAGRGLSDLAEGKCDIAMISFSLDTVAEGANKEKPGSVTDISLFKSELILSEKIVFVVNKANTAGMITQAQMRDILTGKITNWKDVGGSDTPIVIIGLGPTAGPQMALKEGLLKEESLSPNAKIMKAPKEVPPVVSQLPGGIGYIGLQNFKDSVKIAETDCELTMPLLLVTKGEITDTQRKFIEAAKAVTSPK